MGKKTSTDDVYAAYTTDADGQPELLEGAVDKIGSDLDETISDTEKAIEDEPGIYVYLGPSIRGVITNGGIFSGVKADIVKRFEGAAEKFPQIPRLIIKDTGIAAAKEKLSKGKGTISQAYSSLVKAISKEA